VRDLDNAGNGHARRESSEKAIHVVGQGQVTKHGLPSVRHTAFFETKHAEQVRREDGDRPPNMARNQRELPVVLAVTERREAIPARIWPQIKRQKQARCPQGIKVDVQSAPKPRWIL
jgi:hypothetical protein